MTSKERAPRNRTISLSAADRKDLACRLYSPVPVPHTARDCTILGDCLDVAPQLPAASVDLLVLDPPYNLNKRFGDNTFSKRPFDEYTV